jgi:hypothetical protein
MKTFPKVLVVLLGLLELTLAVPVMIGLGDRILFVLAGITIVIWVPLVYFSIKQIYKEIKKEKKE